MQTLQKSLEFFLRKKRLRFLIVFALVVGIGISTFYRGAGGPLHRTDLPVYLKAAEMIQIGRVNHLYGIETARHWHYVYSPFLAILMTLVVNLPFGVNVLLAYGVSVGALAGTFFLSRFFSDKPHGIGWQIALSAIFCFPLFLNTFSRAQLGIISLFFSALIFYCYVKHWKFLTGFLLAFAVTLKISPSAFTLFFFLFKKEWKVLASALLGFSLFFFVFPSLVIGVRTNWELLKTWQMLMAAGSSDKAHTIYLWSELFTPFSPRNQSFYAVLTRLNWPSEAEFLKGSNASLRGIAFVFNVSLLGLLFLKKLPPPAVNTQDRVPLLAEYSLYPMLMLFASPVAEVHHYTSLYLLFLASLFLLERTTKNSFMHRGLLISLWICAFSVFLNYAVPPLRFLGGLLWGAMLLWSVVLFSIKKATAPLRSI